MKRQREEAAHALCAELGVDPLDDALRSYTPASELAAQAFRAQQKAAMERLLRNIGWAKIGNDWHPPGGDCPLLADALDALLDEEGGG